MKRILAAGLFVTSLAMVADAQVYVRIGPPPPPRREVVVPRPGPRYVWVNGYHRWDGGRYAWVPGSWVMPPNPRFRHWVPGHWRNNPRGYYWVEGHWR